MLVSIPKLNLTDLVDPGLSPVLLTRARLLAAEHEKLSGRLADSFDAKIAKRAGELAPSTAILKEWDNANEVSSLILPALLSHIIRNVFLTS